MKTMALSKILREAVVIIGAGTQGRLLAYMVGDSA